MPVSSDQFREALSRFASGVTVVTTSDADGGLHGLTVSAFSSVSLDPPLVLICIEKATASHNAFVESGLFAVNILSSTQRITSQKFASPLENKFRDLPYSVSELGLPVLSGCVANLECRIKERFDGGDHTIFIGSVEHVLSNDGDPLIYFRGTYGTTTGDA